MEPVRGEPWPVEREVHAACCLNYGQDHPQLLVHGGLDNGRKTLGDMWIFEFNTTGKWTEVNYWHFINYEAVMNTHIHLIMLCTHTSTLDCCAIHALLL